MINVADLRSFDASVPRRRTLLADLNGANIAAGLTAGLFYAFGAIPVFLNATASLNLTTGAATSWFFITFMTSALSGLILSITLRMPIPVGWTMPGLIFLAGTAGHYSLQEMTGAFLVSGVLIIVLGLAGIGEQLMRWLPAPIVLGMFAGNMLGYVAGTFGHLDAQPVIVGTTIAGFLIGKCLGKVWLQPMGAAVGGGLIASALLGRVTPESFQWTSPSLSVVQPSFDPTSILALSVPLVVMAVGIGNVQGLGYLISQGYRVPIRKLTIWLGVTSLINALFGGHTSAIQNGGSAIVAGPDAGPREARYLANVVAAVIAIGLAACAAAASTLLGVLPAGFVPALAGLALMSAMMESLQKSTKSDLPTGSFFALIIASSGLTALGISAAFWAMIGGLGVSLLLEREAVLRRWRGQEQPT